LPRPKATILLIALLIGAGACASRAPFSLPTANAVPEPDPAPIVEQASGACRAVGALTVELGLSGRVGAEKVRGRLIAGFDARGRVRLEALAPFGAPGFILVGDDRAATLLLPRDGRVVRDADTARLLEALTGLHLTASDLLPLVTGCLVARPEPAGEARRYPNGWVEVPVGGGRTLWAAQAAGGTWQTVAGEVGDVTVAYERSAGPWPLAIRLLRQPAGRSARAGVDAVDLTLAVSGLDPAAVLGDEAFRLEIGDDVREMTVEELRGGRPMRVDEAREREL
jgi:hypothetical protein